MNNTTTLTLIDTGDDIFAVVALLRQYFGLNLAEARALVTALPATLPQLDPAAATSLAEGLASLGATITDRPAAVPEPEYAPQPEHEYAPEPEPSHPADIGSERYGAGRYIFTLDDCGRNKLLIVKIIKNHLDWRLKEAKELADAAPTSVELNVKGLDDMLALVDDIKAAGGRASYRQV